MRLRAMCVLVGLLASCSFEHGLLVPGDGAGGGGGSGKPDGSPIVVDAPIHPASDVAAQAIDAPPPPVNLVSTSAGAVLGSFTSEYCTQLNPPALCQAGYWNHTNINDDQYANGDNQTAYRASWASTLKNNNIAETFEFSFAGNASALIDHFVVQNWRRGGGGNLYYSTHAQIYGRAPASTTWTLLVDTALATNETPQSFALAAPVTVDRVRFSITDGLRSDYWELGELEAWGWLQ
jgi:hypothetical protein